MATTSGDSTDEPISKTEQLRLATVTYGPYVAIALIGLVVLVELVAGSLLNVTWPVVALLVVLAVAVNLQEFDRIDVHARLRGVGSEVAETRARFEEAVGALDRREASEVSRDVGIAAGRRENVEDLRDELYALLAEAPTLAIAKLRDELESEPPRSPVAGTAGADGLAPGAPTGPGYPPGLAAVYADVIDLFDRAIDRRDVDRRDGVRLVSLGLDLLSSLRRHDHDEVLRSGATYWAGMDLLVASEDLDPRALYGVARVEGAGDLADPAATFVAGPEREFHVDTDDLPPGRYVLTEDGEPVGVDPAGRLGRDRDIDAASFQLEDQRLSATLETGWVLNEGGKTDDVLSVESNRVDYALLGTVHGLGSETVASAFAEDESFVGTISNGTTTYALLDGSGDQAIEVDFTGVDPGDYDVVLTVPDTGDQASASISVQTY